MTTTPERNRGGRPRTPHGQLTAHELTVVTELAKGGTYAQIGRRMGIAPTAVRAAVGRAYRRLDANTPAHVIARAIGLRLIPPHIALTRADLPAADQ